MLMTAYATVPQAVEAIQAGAYDYLVKPFSIDQVGHVLDRALEVQRLRFENHSLRTVLGQPVLLESSSPAMRRAIETARRAARLRRHDPAHRRERHGQGRPRRRSSSLEPASGRSPSSRSRVRRSASTSWKASSSVTSRAHSPALGRTRQAGSKPRRATRCFSTKSGSSRSPLQAKLLRFLEERRFERVGGRSTVEIDVRVLAATNRHLESDVASGNVSEDLFHRLNVLRIELPPLRDRSEDLIPLARHILAIRAAPTAARPLRCSRRRKRRSVATAGPETCVSSSTCWHMQWSSAAVARSRSTTCRIGYKLLPRPSPSIRRVSGPCP